MLICDQTCYLCCYSCCWDSSVSYRLSYRYCSLSLSSTCHNTNLLVAGLILCLNIEPPNLLEMPNYKFPFFSSLKLSEYNVIPAASVTRSQMSMSCKSWTYPETQALLDIWQQEHIQTQLTLMARNRPVWEQVAEIMKVWGFYLR